MLLEKKNLLILIVQGMKNKFRLLVSPFLLMVIFMSCGDRPSYVLSDDKMVDLMVDMQLAEAYSSLGASGRSAGKVELGKQVLKAHGVDEATLDSTLAWYGRNLDEYSELFEKVDKELLKRKKRYTQDKGSKPVENENLWPYAQHLVLSDFSGSPALSFSFPAQDIKKGDVLELSFALSNPVAFNTTFGVEYSDGHGEGLVSNFNNKNTVRISLFTDTLRKVSRVYGSLQVKDNKYLPLYIDSLKLELQPFDSINYRSGRRNQKTFGAIVKRPPQIVAAKNDSTLNQKDSLINKKDTLLNNVTQPDKLADKANRIEGKPNDLEKGVQVKPKSPEKIMRSAN